MPRPRKKEPRAASAPPASAATEAAPQPPTEAFEIEFRQFKEIAFRPVAVIVGISSAGPVGPLAASQVIQRLRMDQVCGIDSPWFPAMSVVYFQKPKFPARIYASKRHRLIVVLAEFEPLAELARPLAHAVLQWAHDHGAQRIIGIEGFEPSELRPIAPVAVVGSTDAEREWLARSGLPGVLHGAVPGVAGILLNEGRWVDQPVSILNAAVGNGIQDAEAALHVLHGLQTLLPKIPLKARDNAPEPTELEKAVRAARRRASTHEFI